MIKSKYRITANRFFHNNEGTEFGVGEGTRALIARQHARERTRLLVNAPSIGHVFRHAQIFSCNINKYIKEAVNENVWLYSSDVKFFQTPAEVEGTDIAHARFGNGNVCRFLVRDDTTDSLARFDVKCYHASLRVATGVCVIADHGCNHPVLRYGFRALVLTRLHVFRKFAVVADDSCRMTDEFKLLRVLVRQSLFLYDNSAEPQSVAEVVVGRIRTRIDFDNMCARIYWKGLIPVKVLDFCHSERSRSQAFKRVGAVFVGCC